MEYRSGLKELDGIEILSIKNQQVGFPEHYHDTFCISLIEDGVEAIKMGDNTIFSEQGHITINNPYEIHANPVIDKQLTNSFTTVYLSPDLVDHFLNQKQVHFSHQQAIDTVTNTDFKYMVKAIKNQDSQNIEASLKSFLSKLTVDSKSGLEDLKYSNRKWSELIVLIENKLEEKITLDFLAKFMDMNKFNFAKAFRSRYGLSPINYVIMKKIFKSKELISRSTNLTQLAYQFDFADQAHFSKQFKRFIGMPPRAYKNQLI
jgi:AraC-like DNA-binding protein